MDDLFEKIIDNRDGYILRDVAAEALKWCEEQDADLLEGWLRLRAEDMIWQTLSHRESKQRARSATVNRHAVFEEALRSASPGGDQQQAKDYLSMLDTRFACNPDQVRKKYGQMSQEEVLFVAGTYGRLENRSRLRRMFHEAVANQLLPGEVVGDKFTPHRLLGIQMELGISD
jgi:hypothetical protein